jgi:hypothetical protein
VKPADLVKYEYFTEVLAQQEGGNKPATVDNALSAGLQNEIASLFSAPMQVSSSFFLPKMNCIILLFTHLKLLTGNTFYSKLDTIFSSYLFTVYCRHL